MQMQTSPPFCMLCAVRAPCASATYPHLDDEEAEAEEVGERHKDKIIGIGIGGERAGIRPESCNDKDK